MTYILFIYIYIIIYVYTYIYILYTGYVECRIYVMKTRLGNPSYILGYVASNRVLSKSSFSGYFVGSARGTLFAAAACPNHS